MLLAIELNDVRNFCQQMPNFAIPFAFENIEQIYYEERAFDHLYLLLAYYIWEILQIESIVLLYFDRL